MATEDGVEGAYHKAMPYPLGGAVRLYDKVIVELNLLLRSAEAVIEGAI